MTDASKPVTDTGKRATCRKCGAMWRFWSNDTASLLDGRQRPGQCCDNAPDWAEHLMYWEERQK